MTHFYHKVINHRHFRFGAPFFLFILGGHYALSSFRSVRYDRELNQNLGQFVSAKEEMTKAKKELREIEIQKGHISENEPVVPPKSAEETLDILEKSNAWDSYENKRIPRPWENTKNI